MIRLARRLARDGRVWCGVVGAGLLVLAAGCASGRPPAASLSPTSAPAPAACEQWACRPRQTVPLAGQRALTLWTAASPTDYQSRPVLELADHGVPVQWWIAPQGDGWAGSLTCLALGPVPNCALLDSLGMHANVAEIVLLQGGRLVHPSGAQAIADSPGLRAADLDGDGYLDIIGSTNDYQPDYAQGHNYWKTFRYSDGRLIATGCAPQPAGSPAPARLLTGACPTAG